jgi:hypothetical protein
MLATLLGDALHIEFCERDSLHRGEYYSWRGESSEALLQANFVPEEGELLVNSAPESKSLLWLTETDGQLSRAVEEKLKGWLRISPPCV